MIICMRIAVYACTTLFVCFGKINKIILKSVIICKLINFFLTNDQFLLTNAIKTTINTIYVINKKHSAR